MALRGLPFSPPPRRIVGVTSPFHQQSSKSLIYELSSSLCGCAADQEPNVTPLEKYCPNYSPNIGTCRVSVGSPFLRRRVAPITASTISDSKAVRGTKMRCVLERRSGGLIR